nr:hypothetical protein [Tanacetum cinerariifolium]
MSKNHSKDRLVKEVLMIELVMHTEKNGTVFHMEKTGMVILVVEIDVGGMTADVVEKLTCSSDDVQPKQVDLRCAHALTKLHWRNIHVVPDRREVNQGAMKISSKNHRVTLPSVEAVQIILTRIDNDIYSTVDACPKVCEMWKAIERSAGYENQRTGNVAGARETVGSTMVQKSGIQCYNCKEFGHVMRECQKPKRVKDVAYHREKMLLCFYNDNLALMLAPESDEVIRLEKESRSKLSDLIGPSDYNKLNNLYDLFVPQREKSSEQRYFSERSRLSHTSVNNGNLKESFNKQTTLLEKRMDESISLDKKCQSSIEIFKVKTYVNTIINRVELCKEKIEKRMDESISLDKKCQSSIEIFKVKTYVNTIINRVELCKEKIGNRTYSGYIDPFIQNTIEAKFSPVISRINAGLEQFHKCLNEKMIADLRYFNSIELEVDYLRSQLETQKT